MRRQQSFTGVEMIGRIRSCSWPRVRSGLEAPGESRSDMVVSGRGIGNPRIPTALGVREPQNRRVEIAS